MGKKSPKRKMADKLDKLWADKVKVGGSCVKCGKTSYLNAHHIYSRSNRAVRWYLPNGICLCSGCHTLSSKFSAHKTPMEFSEFVLNLRGNEWLEDLKLKSREVFDGDYDRILSELDT